MFSECQGTCRNHLAVAPGTRNIPSVLVASLAFALSSVYPSYHSLVRDQSFKHSSHRTDSNFSIQPTPAESIASLPIRWPREDTSRPWTSNGKMPLAVLTRIHRSPCILCSTPCARTLRTSDVSLESARTLFVTEMNLTPIQPRNHSFKRPQPRHPRSILPLPLDTPPLQYQTQSLQ